MVITTVSNQQLLPNLPSKIQMANTLKSGSHKLRTK
jgi:hypothetical protein